MCPLGRSGPKVTPSILSVLIASSSILSNSFLDAAVKVSVFFKDCRFLISVAFDRSAINSLMLQAILPVEKDRSITNNLLFPIESISGTPFTLNAFVGIGGCATGPSL